jgi:hypothetical protein
MDLKLSFIVEGFVCILYFSHASHFTSAPSSSVIATEVCDKFIYLAYLNHVSLLELDFRPDSWFLKNELIEVCWSNG